MFWENNQNFTVGGDIVEDIKLVEGILSGDVECFNQLMMKYEPIVQRFVYNMIKEKHTAEDISQEVFITIYNKIDMYNRKCKLSSWILQIAKNKTIDYIRKYKKAVETDIQEVRGVATDELSPEEALEVKETKEEIKSYIDGLNQEDKQIIILKYSKGITFDDIAEIIDMKVSTVKRRFYKAREGFRKQRDRKRGVECEM